MASNVEPTVRHHCTGKRPRSYRLQSALLPHQPGSQQENPGDRCRLKSPYARTHPRWCVGSVVRSEIHHEFIPLSSTHRDPANRYCVRQAEQSSANSMADVCHPRAGSLRCSRARQSALGHGKCFLTSNKPQKTGLCTVPRCSRQSLHRTLVMEMSGP